MIAAKDAGERLDVWLARQDPRLTRAQAQRAIRAGLVTVNGRPGRPGQSLQPGETIEWALPPPTSSRLAAEPIPLDIVFEDAALLVVNKPAGMVVHPAPGHPSGTLVNALMHHCRQGLPATDDAGRPGLVHRLDKDTSGLLVVARTDAALRALQGQLSERTMSRRYLALVFGNPRFERAEVDAPIGRDPHNRQRMAVLAPDSRHSHRPAFTELIVRERFPGMALIEARLRTGRTHQVRVHCAYGGHPVVGDPTYGPRSPSLRQFPPAVREAVEALPGQALHAYSLAFAHPVTGERRAFTIEPPAAFRRMLKALGASWRLPDAGVEL